MPPSPSFHSDTRKWKRQKREITRRHKQDDDDDVEDEEDEQDNNDAENRNLDDSDDLQHPAAPSDPAGSNTEVLIDGGTRICDFPSVVRRAVNRPHASVTNVVATERENLCAETSSTGRSSVMLENISYGQSQALSVVPADCDALDSERSDGGNSTCVITPPQIMEGKGVVKRFGNRVHVVPMHSDWFSPATVHRLERQVVPHFFSGKSSDHTPEKYMEYRNHIVSKYMYNPEKRLTVLDCQGLADGVTHEDLTRIFRFLNHWGIINYCAAATNPESQTNSESWNSGSYLREDLNGEVHMPSAHALKSIDSLIKFDKPKCSLKTADVYSSLSCHDGDFFDLDNRIRESLSENHCNYCSKPIPVVYYQSQKEVDILLCSDCFHDGRFVTGHSSLDFMRVDSAKNYGDLDGETWSDRETFFLLEAIERYNENWNEIAEHVGTKSKAQCILHFVRLPMEDGLLENIEVPNRSRPSNSRRDDREGLHSTSNRDLPGSCLQEADSESRLPFANSGNPVMSLVAFLASAVGPRVAAACAHTSLAVLSEQVEGLGHGNRINSESMHNREGGFHGELAHSVPEKEENSVVHGSQSQNGSDVAPLSTEKVKAAAKAGLAAAATKAKLFADHEEREIQRLSANIINHQLKRLELKLKQFAELETLLMRECEQVEKARQRFAAEWARIVSTRFGPAGVPSQTSVPGVTPSMVNNNIGNKRQQVISASPSQPSISGFGTNQPVLHPHMQQFRSQQPIFPMGPRMSAGSLQASSSSPSNVMFNPPGNSQPTLNHHPMLRSVSGTGSGLG